MSGARPVALVTGGCHRLGAAIAARLAWAGHDLALHGHRHREPEPALLEAMTAAGVRHVVLTADLGDADAATRLIDQAGAALGRAPSLLVNNASRFVIDDGLHVTGDALSAHFSVNLIAPVLLAQALAQALPEGATGAVVNILDQRIKAPPRDQLAYTLSKQGLAEATRTLALAMAPRVRVNAVAPGLTLPTAEYADDQMARLAALMPLRRLAGPGEIADAVHFLAMAPSVTGQTLFVDGGASLTHYDRDFVHLAQGGGD